MANEKSRDADTAFLRGFVDASVGEIARAFNEGRLEASRVELLRAARIEEAKLGKNPMQNSEICAKNHSLDRNKKCSETLKEKGRLGLLPQQIESQNLKVRARWFLPQGQLPSVLQGDQSYIQ